MDDELTKTYEDGVSDGIDIGIEGTTKTFNERKERENDLKKKKAAILAAAGTLAVGGAGAVGYAVGQKNADNIVIESQIEAQEEQNDVKEKLQNLDQISSIEDADIEILRTWVGNTKIDSNNESAKEKSVEFNKLYFEYKEALSTPLYGYVPTQLNYDPERDGNLEENHYNYEDEVAKIKQKLMNAAKEFENATGNKFTSSIFRYAYVNEDKVVMVPCAKDLSGVDLPENFEVQTKDGKPTVYIPYSSYDEENINALSK